jgi:hypothetical protein
MSPPVPPVQPIQLELTEEQQELIRRLSGQIAQVLELVPEKADPAAGVGHALQFSWRLSVASGIPRQKWDFGPKQTEQPDSGKSSG